VIGKLLHQFLLLLWAFYRVPFQLLLCSSSALDPLLVSKLFPGEQLQISAPRVFFDRKALGLASRVWAV
jgi:hypothetical protein